jgi:hypothetical protein
MKARGRIASSRPTRVSLPAATSSAVPRVGPSASTPGQV